MNCPKCKGSQVWDMTFQSIDAQVYCESCGLTGTFVDFGVDKERNIGLATQFEGAALQAEQNFYDASDPDKTLAVSVHEVDGSSACNIWIRLYGQRLKVMPERILEGSPSGIMLMGEVMRFIQVPDHERLVSGDFRWGLALRGVQDQISRSMGEA